VNLTTASDRIEFNQLDHRPENRIALGRNVSDDMESARVTF
jgi:hypothetical protein